MQAPSRQIVLGSQSPFRRQLLEKLNIPFTTLSPNIDESRQEGESPEALVKRLACEKAKAIYNVMRCNEDPQSEQSLIIGSDQVAVFGEQILGKPHTEENAINQLKLFSGNKVSFNTGLALLDTSDHSLQVELDIFHVHFRHLTDDEIKAYIKAEKPLNCAGSFKSEGLGITLFEKLDGDDPNSLIGLPLIRLCRMLTNQGLNPLTYSAKTA